MPSECHYLLVADRSFRCWHMWTIFTKDSRCWRRTGIFLFMYIYKILFFAALWDTDLTFGHTVRVGNVTDLILWIHTQIKCQSLVNQAYSSIIFLETFLSKFAQQIPFAKWNILACKSYLECLKKAKKWFFLVWSYLVQKLSVQCKNRKLIQLNFGLQIFYNLS